MRILKDKSMINLLKADEPQKTDFIQEQTEEETTPASPVNVLADFGARITQTITKEELLKKLFPRGPKTLVAVKGGKVVAQDSAIKPAMYTDDLPEEMVPFFTQTFIGWQACALLAQNPYIKKACEIPAREAVAVDYKLRYTHPDGDQDSSTDEKAEQEILNNLKTISDKKMGIKDVCRDANVFKKMFGQIVAVPSFSTDMRKAMEKPYTPGAVKKGTYTGMALVQPFWITYQLSGDGVARPDKNGYYEPEYYIINGDIKIHKSWVTKLVNGALADILKPVYYYGGVPLTQQIYERVFCAEKTANEAPKLALTKRLLVVDGNVNNMAANPEEAFKALQNVLAVRDNMGLMVKNPGDAVQQIDTTLSDMDALIMTQYQLVAAIAEMPVTKLIKTQLKGLANTGDYEMRDYNQSLAEIQENDFNRIMDKHFEYLCLSEYGRNLEVETVWNPIDTPTEEELARIEQTQAATDAQYIQVGVLDPSEVRAALRNSEDSRFHSIEEEMPEQDIDFDLGSEEENNA